MSSAPIVNMKDAPACLEGAVCAFGVFDGLHLGHRFIIGKAIEDAHAIGCPVAVLTFDKDPDELFKGDALHKLMTNDERLDALSKCGVDIVGALGFDREFAALSPDEFLDTVLGAGVPRSLHVGNDLRFGAHAAGTVETLEQWGSQNGMGVYAYELLEIDGEPVTSSRIRELLDEGQSEEARKLLAL